MVLTAHNPSIATTGATTELFFAHVFKAGSCWSKIDWHQLHVVTCLLLRAVVTFCLGWNLERNLECSLYQSNIHRIHGRVCRIGPCTVNSLHLTRQPAKAINLLGFCKPILLRHTMTHPHLSVQFQPAPPPKEARNAARAATSCLAPGLGRTTNPAAWTLLVELDNLPESH